MLVALAAGSRRVTAAEMNPLMLQFVRHFGDKAGNLYDQPKVNAILTEGRTFIRRTAQTFDVILLGFVDSWAAVASGGLSLSENHLYTVEAFRAYYDHLTPDGMLVILRWRRGRPPTGDERGGPPGRRRRPARESRFSSRSGGPRATRRR